MTPNIHWLSIELCRELNYIQDYFQNLTNFLEDIPPEKYPEIALMIKADITNLAQNINNKTRIFFEKETISMKTKITGGHHKLPKEDTIKRLEATLLFKNHAKIREYIDL